VVVADESHFLKNDKAQRTKATLPLIKRATRAVLLTGTPATNRPGTNYAPKPTPC
jgi:SWI/SNF-related matrix-associated actin-dependent regulator of chromatin subfamily A-like protein 1